MLTLTVIDTRVNLLYQVLLSQRCSLYFACMHSTVAGQQEFACITFCCHVFNTMFAVQVLATRVTCLVMPQMRPPS